MYSILDLRKTSSIPEAIRGYAEELFSGGDAPV